MTPKSAASRAPASTPAASPASHPFASLLRLAPRAEAIAVIAAVLFALLYWARLPGRLPSEADYLAMQHELVGAAHPGDAVAVLPFWADHAKLFVHGLPVIALPDLAHEGDVERYPRLWVVAQPDLPRSDAAHALAELDQKLTRREPPKRFGPLSLSLYEPRAGRAGSYDFVERLSEAQVDVAGEGCQAVSGGFQCPRGQWNYVHPEWHEFDFLPRRCLWAHPVGTDPLEIRYSQVPLHGGVRGGFGLIGQAAAVAQAAPVDLAIDVDGSEAASLELSPGDPGWHPFELGLPEVAPGTHDVTFRVTTPNPGMRHFCFDASAF